MVMSMLKGKNIPKFFWAEVVDTSIIFKIDSQQEVCKMTLIRATDKPIGFSI